MPCHPKALERELNLVRASAVNSRSGIFGAQSAIWHIDREAAIFLGAGRALLLQLAHPWVAAATFEYFYGSDRAFPSHLRYRF